MITVPWHVSASLENVVRGSVDVAEVTSLEECVREWLRLDRAHRDDAKVVVEEPFQFRGDGPTRVFDGAEIARLAEFLPI